MNGELVTLVHVPPAHTDTDIFIHYTKANVLHMSLVRAIARDASRNDNRFSALILGVVKSQAFQMNVKGPGPATVGKVQEPVALTAKESKKGSN